LSVRTLAGQALHADPKVPARFNQRVAQLITEARARTRRITGIDAAPPAIYVHASTAMLRQREAIGNRRVAFYEGALHVAYVPREQELSHQLFDGVNHEYVHHALLSRGIHGPSWLQEALAMQASRERGPDIELQPPGLDLRVMAEESPHQAQPEQAARFYGQAKRMLSLLQELCGGEPDCDDRELVAALADGAPADGFFEDVIAARSPSTEQSPLELWQGYLDGVRPEP
jgi:hypothetical protein